MNFKANFEAVTINSAQTYTFTSVKSASTVHQLYCLSAGTVTITALGGGTFDWNATVNTSLDVLVSKAVVTGNASFIGFRSQFFANQSGPFRAS